MLSAARRSRVKSQWVNGLIGALVVCLTLLYVRNAFGFAFGLLFGLAMFAVSKNLAEGVNRTLLLALGLTSALYALLDIKSDILDRPEARSDAAMLADITGISTAIWGILWIGAAIAFSAWLFRRAYRDA
jgi:hypothetical protein